MMSYRRLAKIAEIRYESVSTTNRRKANNDFENRKKSTWKRTEVWYRDD